MEYMKEEQILGAGFVLNVIEMDCANCQPIRKHMTEDMTEILQKICLQVQEVPLDVESMFNICLVNNTFPLWTWRETMNSCLLETSIPCHIKIFVSDWTEQDKAKYLRGSVVLNTFLDQIEEGADLENTHSDNEDLSDDSDTDYETILRLTLLQMFEESNITKDSEMTEILQQFHSLRDLLNAI